MKWPKRNVANQPHTRAVSELIERYGARLVLEAVADYCHKNLGLSVFGSPFAAAVLKDDDEARVSPPRR